MSKELESAIEKLEKPMLQNGRFFTREECKAILDALKPKTVDVESFPEHMKKAAIRDNLWDKYWEWLQSEEDITINDLVYEKMTPRAVFDWFLANLPQVQSVEGKGEKV